MLATQQRRHPLALAYQKTTTLILPLLFSSSLSFCRHLTLLRSAPIPESYTKPTTYTNHIKTHNTTPQDKVKCFDGTTLANVRTTDPGERITRRESSTTLQDISKHFVTTNETWIQFPRNCSSNSIGKVSLNDGERQRSREQPLSSRKNFDAKPRDCRYVALPSRK